MPRLIRLSVAAGVLACVPAPAAAHTALTKDPTYNTVKDGCDEAERLHTVQDYRSYASRVYRRPAVSKAAHGRLREMHVCQHSFAARKAVGGHHRRYVRERRARQALPYPGPNGTRWAIPWRIVRCESRGRWGAYNSSGAAGPYQIMAMHGRPFPVRTQAHRNAHHRIAARLWRGGRGAGQWVCK